MPAPSLLLFDIDGTLVDTEGAGLISLREGFQAAFPEHLGSPFPPLELGGATDGGVAMGLFSHFGIADVPESRARFFRHYTERLGIRLGEFAREGRGRLLPGVAALLDLLAGEGRHRLAVLTGNLREGARIKLSHYRIERHFATGAFGDDHHDRDQLGPVAQRRAAEVFGATFSPERIAVIGDTPRDIACARAFGARAVAVATGGVAREQLAEAAPDLLLDSFADTRETLRAIERLFESGARSAFRA